MIHHVSIPAREPRYVAEVLAELIGGTCHPFGPLEGTFMATSGDAWYDDRSVSRACHTRHPRQRKVRGYWGVDLAVDELLRAEVEHRLTVGRASGAAACIDGLVLLTHERG